MKRKLLFAMLCIVSALGLSAQTWTSSEVGEGYALLYNVGTGKYFTKGNGWGTQASAFDKGAAMTVELIAEGENYRIRTGDYGLEHLSGGTCYTDQSRNKKSTWAFQQVDTQNGPVYNIVSVDNHGGGAGAYLTVTDTDNGIVGPGNDGSADNAKWKIFLYTDQQDKLQFSLGGATESDPVDASAYIGNADFASYKNISDVFWTMNSSNYNANGGAATNPCAESCCAAFTLTQKMTVPNGRYKLKAQAALTDYTNNYDGDNYPVVYINGAETPFNEMESADRGTSMSQLSNSFTAGKYEVETDIVTVMDNTVSIGVRGTRTNTWCIWDNFQLYYVGGVPFSAYAEALSQLVTDAQNYDKEVPTAAKKAIDDVVEEYNKEWTSEEEYSTAIQAINKAIADADALVADYLHYNVVKNAIQAVGPTVDLAEADADAEAALTADALEAAVKKARAALSTALADANYEDVTIDLTNAVIDNATPTSNANYWTVTNASGTAAKPNAFDAGNNNAEFWNQGGFSIKQTLAALPTGYYRLTAVAVTRDGMQGVLSANDNVMNIVTMPNSPADGVSGLNNRSNCKVFFDNGNGVNELTFAVDEQKDVTIGLTADNTTGDHWTVWRSFKLEYLGTAPLGALEEMLQKTIDSTRETAYALAVPAAVQQVLLDVTDKYETEKSGYTVATEYTDAMEKIKEALAVAKTAEGPTAQNMTILGKSEQTAALIELGDEAKATLQAVNAANAAALDACKTAADIEKQNDALWLAIADAIGTIELTGDETLDLSYLLVNGDLTDVASWKPCDGWYTDQPDGNSQVMNNDAATSEDGTKTKFYEYWSNPAKANDTFALYQKVKLGEGVYSIGCYAFAQDQYQNKNVAGVYFYANDTQGSVVNAARLTEAQIDFVNDKTQDVKIGLKTLNPNTYNWMGIGYVTLTKVAKETIEISENVDYTPASAAGDVKVTRTIKAGTWNTLVLPFQVKNEELKAAFGDDVEVAEESEVANGDLSTINFTKMETPALAPNKPVLLKTAKAGTEYTFQNRTVAAGEPVVAGTNFDFQGTYAASTTVAAGDYFLSADNIFQSEGKTTVKGTHAYLKAKAAGVRAELFIDGVATAIEAIDADTEAQNGAVYNLSGQRVQKAQRGLYIVNGKKVVIK